jgi:hypothetical protein
LGWKKVSLAAMCLPLLVFMLHLQVSSQQGTFTSYLQEAPASYDNCEQCIFM